MIEEQLSDTQPVRVRKTKPIYLWLMWLMLSVLFLWGMVSTGGYLGYRSGSQQIARMVVMNNLISLQEQFSLGIQDFHAGRYDLARQRFEYVVAQDPGYPGVATRLEEVRRVLHSTATATSTSIPPTITPTSTHDMRPIAAIFQEAQDSFLNNDWDAVIDASTALRQVDPSYQVTEVDSLLYRALQSRGVDKIRKARNLEGGIYDLSLAEKFGPLDATAQGWRNLARLYLIGSGFWQVYPEQAVYYFGQVASGAPYLRDASGWTATERYRASLIHYGDQLASQGLPCAAQEQYALALAIHADIQIFAQATEVSYQCSMPTHIAASLTFAPTWTSTATLALITPGVTPTPPSTGLPTNSPSQTPTATQGAQPVSSPTLIPTETAPPQPAVTETPTPPADQNP